MPTYFFFNDTATTEIYTLSLHDALPISSWSRLRCSSLCADTSHLCIGLRSRWLRCLGPCAPTPPISDRKSTRLNSSHQIISYAVFCLKKKKGIEASKKYSVMVDVYGLSI